MRTETHVGFHVMRPLLLPILPRIGMRRQIVLTLMKIPSAHIGLKHANRQRWRR
jgi:hypothetical protein